MDPSSFMISQMTPAGIIPAKRARSTEASVWPARTRTVSGACQIGRARGGIDGYFDGVGAIMGGDSSGDTVASVDGFAESGAVLRRVLAGHGADAQVFEALVGHGEADQAASVLGHEVDGFGGDSFRSEGQVAFVFAVFVVDDDDHAAGADFFDGGGDVGEG
jgi:hypothetical protein